MSQYIHQEEERQNGGLSIEEAQSVIRAMSMVNADEVIPDEVEVEVREWKVMEYEDEHGHMRRRRKATKSLHTISTFVPTKLYLMLLKSQQDRMQANSKSGYANFRWMEEQVLNVWKQSEEDMTLEKLEEGVAGEKVSELFYLFFGRMLRAAQNIKASTGVDMQRVLDAQIRGEMPN